MFLSFPQAADQHIENLFAPSPTPTPNQTPTNPQPTPTPYSSPPKPQPTPDQPPTNPTPNQPQPSTKTSPLSFSLSLRKDHIKSAFGAVRAARGLVYCSLGSGQLLFDWELLEHLTQRHDSPEPATSADDSWDLSFYAGTVSRGPKGKPPVWGGPLKKHTHTPTWSLLLTSSDPRNMVGHYPK